MHWKLGENGWKITAVHVMLHSMVCFNFGVASDGTIWHHHMLV